jgi:hypothetical protein
MQIRQSSPWAAVPPPLCSDSVIDCPFCHAPLAETAPSCPRCNLDLQRTRGLLGPVPLLSPSGLTDLSQVLSAADEKSTRQATTAFHRRFPQCRILIIIKDFAPQFPLGVHLFWLFNTAGLSAEELKFGRNRDILIGVDPQQHHAGLIVGYGLEPFLPQTALERVLECATPHFKSGQVATGLTTLIDQLSNLMEGICQELPSVLGLDQDLVVQSGHGKEY